METIPKFVILGFIALALCVIGAMIQIHRTNNNDDEDNLAL